MPENCMQNQLWNSCLDFITKEMWPFKFIQIEPYQLLVMYDSEISIVDSIRFFEKNLDFELRAIFTV